MAIRYDDVEFDSVAELLEYKERRLKPKPQKQVPEKIERKQEVCVECGRVFNKNISTKIYCSEQCRNRDKWTKKCAKKNADPLYYTKLCTKIREQYRKLNMAEQSLQAMAIAIGDKPITLNFEKAQRKILSIKKRIKVYEGLRDKYNQAQNEGKPKTEICCE